MILSNFIAYATTLNNLHGVTCTFHSNISPCVNLKNDRFSDYKTEGLSLQGKTLIFV